MLRLKVHLDDAVHQNHLTSKARENDFGCTNGLVTLLEKKQGNRSLGSYSKYMYLLAMAMSVTLARQVFEASSCFRVKQRCDLIYFVTDSFLWVA